MAFTEFTCRSGGSNLYAGSLDGSAEASTTPLVTYTNGGWNSATGVFTPASGNPVSAGVVVGNWVSVYTDGASAPTGFVARVTAVSSTTITLSTSAKAGTAPTTAGAGVTAVVGGAWLGPNGASGFPFGFAQGTMTNSSGDYPRINLKNDQTYAVTAAVNDSQNSQKVWQGYSSTFGDGGKFVLDGGTSGASYVLLSITANTSWLRDAEIRNNGASGSSNGLVLGFDRQGAERVVVHDVRGSGLQANNTGVQVLGCEFYNCNQSNTSGQGGAVASGAYFERCVFHDNAGSNSSGVTTGGSGGQFVDCVFDTNTLNGIRTNGNNGVGVTGCSFYGQGGSGIGFGVTAGTASVTNSAFVSNGAYGIDPASANLIAVVRNCAFFNNTSGQVNVTSSSRSDVSGSVTLTGNPFTDAANGDFRLNSTSGAGAACRGAGIGTFTQTQSGYAGTVGYPDIGAAQHLDAGGGSSGGFVLGG